MISINQLLNPSIVKKIQNTGIDKANQKSHLIEQA